MTTFHPLPDPNGKPDYARDDAADAERQAVLGRVLTLAGMASVAQLEAAEAALKARPR